MNELFVFLSKSNNALEQYMEKEYYQLMMAIDEYYKGNIESVITICAPLCEKLIRKVCEKEGITCNSNMYDMLEKITSSNINCPKVVISYLHLLRTLMNQIRHALSEGHEIIIFDACTSITATFYLLAWYLKRYYAIYDYKFAQCINEEDNSYEQREKLLISLINDKKFPMCKEILQVIYEEDVSVDALIQKINSSRMVVLKSVVELIENNFIRWKSNENDILMVNDFIYNNTYLIGKVLKE